jgi:hypothetical protein
MSGVEQKRSPRVPTSIAAVLVEPDGGEHSVEILDLSSGGVRLRAGEPLVIGENARLRVPCYGEFPVHVQWAKGQDAGCQFLDRMTL